jgi:hypothetical protein
MENLKNKSGQIAIWFIVAIAIVAIIIFFLLVSRVPLVQPQKGDVNFQTRMEQCVKESVNNAVDKMLSQGGFLEPTNYKIYHDIKVDYICENKGYYKPCISQHPMLLNDEIKEIENYIKPITNTCFENAKVEFEKKGNTVIMLNMDLNVSMGPDRVFVGIQREVTVQKGEEISKYKDYSIDINSPLYDLSRIAIEISNQEAKYCYFEYVGYMILYPRYDIRKFAMSDSTKIYTIKDKYSGKELNIGIRSCVIPPGI